MIDEIVVSLLGVVSIEEGCVYFVRCDLFSHLCSEFFGLYNAIDFQGGIEKRLFFASVVLGAYCGCLILMLFLVSFFFFLGGFFDFDRIS